MTISMSDVAKLIGRAAGASISLGETAVRNFIGIPTGTIKLSDFTNIFSLTCGTSGNFFGYWYQSFGTLEPSRSFTTPGNQTASIERMYRNTSDSTLQLVISGASFPNDDTTFVSLKWGTITFTRASATYLGSNQWRWSAAFAATPPNTLVKIT